MDYALLNLLLTGVLLVATFVFRKRILRALGRLLLHGAIEFARATFVVEDVVEGEDGVKTPRIALSQAGKGIVAAVTPVLIAEIAKNVKVKLPGPGGLPLAIPEGADLASLAPAFLGMLPKKYQGLAGLALPFLQGFLKPSRESKGVGGEGKQEMSKITRDLIP